MHTAGSQYLAALFIPGSDSHEQGAVLRSQFNSIHAQYGLTRPAGSHVVPGVEVPAVCGATQLQRPCSPAI